MIPLIEMGPFILISYSIEKPILKGFFLIASKYAILSGCFPFLFYVIL